jgi:hypothetical protein
LIELIADQKGADMSSDRNSYQSSNGSCFPALCGVIVCIAIIWYIFSTLFLSASARIQIKNAQGSPIMVVSKQGSAISTLTAQPWNGLSLMQQVQGWRPWHQPSNLSVAGEDVFLTHRPFVGWSVWTKQQTGENRIYASVLSDDTILLIVMKNPVPVPVNRESVPENREIVQPSRGLRDTVHGMKNSMKNRIEGLRGFSRALTP